MEIIFMVKGVVNIQAELDNLSRTIGEERARSRVTRAITYLLS